MPNVIGITGPKRSGKGTVAQLLNENHTGIVYEIGFADKVKIAGAKALGFDRPPRELIALMDEFKIDGQIQVRYTEPGDDAVSSSTLHDLTGRQYLQWVGTEAGRDLYGTDFWIDQVLPNPNSAAARAIGDTVTPEEILETQLAQRYPEIDVVAITDVRFANEAQRIRDLGGKVWLVERPGYGGEDAHASEQRLPDALVDVVIDNSGDLNHLSDEVYAAIEASGI